MSVFAIAILFYLIYRFVAGFIIPVFRSTRVMRQQFHNMNSGQNGQPGNGQPNNESGRSDSGAKGAGPGSNAAAGPQGTAPKTSSSSMGEYIDFEEVK